MDDKILVDQCIGFQTWSKLKIERNNFDIKQVDMPYQYYMIW